jgi:hypothetical protein
MRTARTSCQTRQPFKHYPSQLHILSQIIYILPHTSPVTENEVENVINTVKGKTSAGFDEIPEFLVKGKFTSYYKNVTHVFNMFVKFGIFPYLIKTAKNRRLF